MLGLDHSGGLILFASVTKHWRIEIFFFVLPRLPVHQLLACVSAAVEGCLSWQSYQTHISSWDRPAETSLTENWTPSLPNWTKSMCILPNRYTHTHTHSCTHSCILWCFDSGLWVEIYDPIFIVAIKFQAGQSGGKTVRMIQEDKCFRLKRGCDRMKMCPCVWCLRLWWSFRSVIRWICSSPLGCTALEDGITPQEFWAHLKPDLPLQTADPSKVLPFLALKYFPHFLLNLYVPFCAQFLFVLLKRKNKLRS